MNLSPPLILGARSCTNLRELGLRLTDLLLKTKILEITEKGVRVEKDGAEAFLPADMVVDAFGMKARREEAFGIARKYGHNAVIIGDCERPAQIGEAVRGGYFAAFAIH